MVGETGQEQRSQRLENDVDGDGKIDGLETDVEMSAQQGQEREVDCCCQRGHKHRCAHEDGYQALMPG